MLAIDKIGYLLSACVHAMNDRTFFFFLVCLKNGCSLTSVLMDAIPASFFLMFFGSFSFSCISIQLTIVHREDDTNTFASDGKQEHFGEQHLLLPLPETMNHTTYRQTGIGPLHHHPKIQ